MQEFCCILLSFGFLIMLKGDLACWLVLHIGFLEVLALCSSIFSLLLLNRHTAYISKISWDEALESLKGKEKNSAMMLLESQFLFRLGKMDASVDIYQEIQKSKSHWK